MQSDRETTTAEARFWRNVAPMMDDRGCWEWYGTDNQEGYGYLYADRRATHVRAHRFSYEIHVGPIPDGLVLDHLCRNTLCVNPRHLEPVTNRENIIRGEGPTAQNARRTHCVRGHEFNEANTGTNCRGNRVCRECKRWWRREYRKDEEFRKREAVKRLARRQK